MFFLNKFRKWTGIELRTVKGKTIFQLNKAIHNISAKFYEVVNAILSTHRG